MRYKNCEKVRPASKAHQDSLQLSCKCSFCNLVFEFMVFFHVFVSMFVYCVRGDASCGSERLERVMHGFVSNMDCSTMTLGLQSWSKVLRKLCCFGLSWHLCLIVYSSP